jgi:S-adenosylmethionine:tRNA ribosyltransferase-isomerase
MDVADFSFDLPDELIAQEAPAERGGSRLLVLDRNTGTTVHTTFARITHFLRAGDLLVVNDTKVFPARLLGWRVPSGGAVEALLLKVEAEDELGVGTEGTLGVGAARTLGGGSCLCEALMHPGQKLKPGARVRFERDGVRLDGEVLERHFFGRRSLRLWTDGRLSVAEAIDRIGHIPLPPYIKREDRADDRDRYQTVYARERGSVAAPTAGLHFTPDVLRDVAARGVERIAVTLHVGYGTFKPVRAARVEDHVVDAERFSVSGEAAAALTRARHEGRRIIAVGTTTTRTLESLTIDGAGTVQPGIGETTLFIRPGHVFQIVSGLVTNFHLPQSSLLMLVAAFAGRESVLAAYRDAVARGYRFYSYGDAMLIL